VRFLQRRIHLVTGKGGVGKTTVSAALARAAAAHGQKVLLLEIGDPEGGYSPIGRLFGYEHLSETPRPLGYGVTGAHLWAPAGHEGFLRSVLPAGPLIKAALRSKSLTKFLNAAPSFQEMGIFYHLLMLLESTAKSGEPAYDAVILDMPATGHALALTGLPDLLLNLISVGPMAKALRRGQAFMNDPIKAAAWVVTLPEQLPVTESIELIEGLRATNMTIGGVLVNRWIEASFDAQARGALDDFFAHTPTHGALTLGQLDQAQGALDRLNREADVPVVTLPYTPLGDPMPALVTAATVAMEGPQ
jgi:anion-transporting  ArsA/GET3 family ATPase